MEELLEDGGDLSCPPSFVRYFGGAEEAERAGLKLLLSFCSHIFILQDADHHRDFLNV